MTQPTTLSFRRIITANSQDGRSYILNDGPTPHALQSAPGRGLVNLWVTDNDGPDLSIEDGANRPIQLEPPHGGSIFRFFLVAPRSTMSAEEAEAAAAAAFANMGAAHLRVDTTRHPAMHKSHTLDYIVLLQGRVKLILDQDECTLEPFDVIIQRGTNHAWINLGDEPALMMGVLIDAPASHGKDA